MPEYCASAPPSAALYTVAAVDSSVRAAASTSLCSITSIGGTNVDSEIGVACDGAVVDADDTPNARCRHGNAAQLPRHEQPDRDVREGQELSMRRHIAHHLAEAIGVRIVGRRVDLAQQAEQRGVDLEQHEHKPDRRQR